MVNFKRVLRAATMAAGLGSIAAGQAAAQNTYAFAFGGIILDGKQDADGLIGGAAQSVDTQYGNDFQFGIGVGRNFGKISDGKIGLRGEIELSYSDAGADTIAFSGNGPANEVNVSGGLQSTTLFANIFADFQTNSPLTPFVGAGVGIGRFSQDLVYGPGVQVNESDTAFGAQLIAGVAWAATDRVTLTADARYREFYGVDSNRFAPTGASTGVVSGDVSAFSVNFGARIAF